MEWIALALLGTGAYLIDSGIQNRAPIGFIKTILADPTDIVGKLNAANGTWQPLFSNSDNSALDNKSGGIVEKPGGTGIIAGASGGTPGQSGRLAASELKSLSFAKGQKLTPAAASAMEALNGAYRKQFGKDIRITDSYRSYGAQIAVKAEKGVLAAQPGYSNHGWGLAVDFNVPLNNYNSPEFKWMLENASRFGWVWPTWARKGTPLGNSKSTKHEPWHWEYVGGGGGGSF